MVDPWQKIRENDDSPVIMFPYWAPMALRKATIIDGAEILILLYLFGKVKDDLDTVYASTAEGMRYAGVGERTYYRVINKFRSLGLVKKGNGVYGLSMLIDLIKSLDKEPSK
jgi:hypothetical protein